MRFIKHRQSKPQTAPVSTPHKVRFASDDFNYDLRLNKTAPYWHSPIRNQGVTLGSGPMMFEVGSYGLAQDYLAHQVAAYQAAAGPA